MIQSPRLAKKKKQERMRRLFIWPAVIVVFVIAVVLAFHLQSVSIKEIDISGNSIIKMEDIRAVVDNDLSGNYFHLFPRKNIFIYPRDQIEADVLSAFPRANSVSVSLGDSRVLAVDMTLRKPDSIWCASASSTLSDILSDSCYFFDKSGYIFAEAPNFEGPVFIKYYGNLSGDPIKQTFLGEDAISKINGFLTNLSSLKLTPVSVHVSDDLKEYDIYLQNGLGIYLSGGNSFEDSLNNLALFINSSSTKQTSLNKFNYIDLRYGNKIYYKLKDDNTR